MKTLLEREREMREEQRFPDAKREKTSSYSYYIYSIVEMIFFYMTISKVTLPG